MTAYLSPDKLRLMHLGIDLAIPDIELASLLDDATTIVNAYCNIPLVPSGSSFLGGSAVEQHPWPFPDSVLTAGKRRLYPFHWPIRGISSFSISVGFGDAVPIGVADLFIDNTERWVEVTALFIASNSGLFGTNGWIVPIGGLTVPVAEIVFDYGFDIAEVTDRCFAVDDSNLVFAASHEHWIEDIDHPVVYVGGVTASPQPTIDYLEGRLTFVSPPAGRVTATYRHKLPREIVTATAEIVASQVGEAILREKDMQGLGSIKDDSITITRRKPLSRPDASNLELTVPVAAALLAGYRHWRMG